MTQTEATIKVLQELGGRAVLADIYPRVLRLAEFKKGSDAKATIRTILQRHPDKFRRSAGLPNGWWELVSFQEEIASRDKRIKELEEENSRLKNLKTEDDFVKRMVCATKKIFGVNRKHADYVRQVLIKLGRDEEQEELLAWIERRDQKKKGKSIYQRISNCQVFNGTINDSDFNGGGTNNEG